MVFIGLLAAILTTSAFAPQVIKILKTKGTKDISLLMYTIMSVGLLLWLVYGLLIRDLPIILANTMSFSLSFAVLIFKIRYG